MQKTYFTNSSSQTKKLGKKLAEKIVSPTGFKQEQNQQGSPCILCLQGDLGAGKTCFLQGFAKGLDIKQKITSPSFVILKKFKIDNQLSKIHYQYFYHIDCYRIQKPEEIMDLGFKRMLSDNANIIAIEWPERITKILPKQIIKIKFEFINKNTRKIIILYPIVIHN